PGWGLFSRSRTESAFTHLSFRGAPRREPAFKYLSFRIRFSGEESAFCPGAHPFALFAKRRELFPSHVGAGALTRPGGDFFRAAEGNLPSHTCHSEERRDESLLSYTCRIRFSGEESAFCRGYPILSRFLRKGGDFFRAAEQNLPSHTCHSEERRDESLLSNTCHSESALAVRNLLLRKPPGVPQGLAAFARPGMSKLSLASHQPKLAIGFSGVGIRCSRRGTR